MRALLLVLFAAGAHAQGFGGEELDDCLIELNGTLVPCDEAAEDASAPEAPPVEEAAEPADPQPTPAVVAEPKDERRKSPFERALDDQRVDKTPSPLAILRQSVRDLEADLEREDIESRIESLKLAIKAEKELLDDIEERAERSMLGCARRQNRAWADRFQRGVSRVRMTPAGPVKTKPSGGTMLDLPGCERVRFADDELIARVRRKQAIERELKTRKWRFGERAEEESLRAELEILKGELEEGLPKLRRWTRDPLPTLNSSQRAPTRDAP